MSTLHIILCAVIGYFMGCFSTGIILGNIAKIDIRKYGSKSTGTTNVIRVMGFKMGLMTFIGDFIKAVIAVLLGMMIGGRDGGLIAGLFSVIGHNWPVFYGFKGGKGIACSTAVLLLNVPLEGAIAAAIAVSVIYLSRYVSLGSLSLLFSAAVILPFTRGLWPVGAWALLLFIFAVYRHRTNIQRLMRGTESKFTGKKHDNT